jgi:hypothetical protein
MASDELSPSGQLGTPHNARIGAHDGHQKMPRGGHDASIRLLIGRAKTTSPDRPCRLAIA